MTALPMCDRCGIRPTQADDWRLCEPCFQDECNEVHEAACELQERATRPRMITIEIPPHPDDPDRDTHDDISRLMATLDLTFVEAVEMLAVERGVQEWPHPDEFWP